MKLTASQIKPYLLRLQAEFGSADQQRLSKLLMLLDSESHQISVASALAGLFPDSVSTESQNKRLLDLRQRFNSAAAESGLRVEWCSTGAKSVGAAKRYIWFEGEPLLEVSHTTDELTRVSGNLIESSRGLPLNPEPKLQLREQRGGKPLVRWFVSYAHADGKALDLLQRLRTQLGNNKHYAFEEWSDSQILVGEDWHGEILAALQRSHLGFLFLSHDFLASDYIRQHELPVFVAGRDAVLQGKRAVPLALKAIDFANTDLKGLESRQIFLHEGKPYDDRARHKRDHWAAALVANVCALLQKHAEVMPGPDRGAGPTARPTTPPKRLLARTMLSQDMDCLPHLIESAKGRQTALNEQQLLEADRAKPSEQSVDVLEHLMDWLQAAGAPRLFALLGEYGMGKTITCQRLVRRIEAQQAAGVEDLPQPLYFDLRKLTGLRRGNVPTLEQLVDECIQRGWSPAADLPTARELIARSRDHAQLWVFDGLDEALVHLSEVDGQAFTRELLRLQPLDGHRSHPQTRVLISCRTHFFRTLRDQNQHFTGQERDGSSASDYRALLMLPLGEEQILAYLRHALPDLDPESTLELVRSVHNLSELAERPFTLKLIGEFIPQIEQWRAQGKPVYGVTLYRQMVTRWIDRDNGKHHLRPEHKERLMMHLAAWMWARGQRSIEAGELEPWYHEWLDSQPDLRLRYRDVGADKLEEDLRTATFLVREDEENGQRSGFRFAHSSMQEYFLARHLFDALQRNDRAAWAMPLVSFETRQFFAQLLMEATAADKAVALLGTLRDWRAPYLEHGSEQWLRYGLEAFARRWPAPSLEGLDLQGADLQGWTFAGRSQAEPLDLRQGIFAGASLRETRWHDVLLDATDFSNADLSRCEWWQVQGRGIDARKSRLDGAVFREVLWPETSWEGCTGQSPFFLHTEAPDAWQGTSGVATRQVQSLATGNSVRWHRFEPRAAANRLAISPDGRQVLTASYDSMLRLWEVDSGRCLAAWRGHEGQVTACAFSPDGRQALSVGWDNTLRLWEVDSGRCLASWHGHKGGITACAFSPDGRQALSAGWDNTLRLWELESGRCLAIWYGHEATVTACAFSPDGRQALSASNDRTLRLWEVDSGRCLAAWQEHEDQVVACAFSPDGRLALSASNDRTLRLWEVDSGRCRAIWQGHGNGVTACAFSPDGRQALSASSDGTLRLWEVDSGRCQAAWYGHKGAVDACVFSPDGRQALSAGWDSTLRLWGVDSGRCLSTWRGRVGAVSACAFSPDGRLALSAGWESTLQLWEVDSGRHLAAWQGHERSVSACAFSPDGRQALSASNDHTLRLWEVDSGRCLATWQGHEEWVTACTFSPDGRLALSASNDSTLRLWEVDSGRCRATWEGHEDHVTACAFSPDGRLALSASDDRTLRLWEVDVGRCLATWQGHDGRATACAFSPDGRLALSAGWDHTLRLWEVDSGRCRAVWQGHERTVSACAFSPDGRLALSAGWDNALRLWEVDSGRCLATWQGHEDWIRACAFSPDGRRALSASDDGCLGLWATDEGRLQRLHVLSPREYAVMNGERSELLYASAGCWRWLGAQIHDAEGRLVDLWPAERLVSLPYGE